jgi:hypothetical protein
MMGGAKADVRSQPSRKIIQWTQTISKMGARLELSTVRDHVDRQTFPFLFCFEGIICTVGDDGQAKARFSISNRQKQLRLIVYFFLLSRDGDSSCGVLLATGCDFFAFAVIGLCEWRENKVLLLSEKNTEQRGLDSPSSSTFEFEWYNELVRMILMMVDQMGRRRRQDLQRTSRTNSYFTNLLGRVRCTSIEILVSL